MSNAGRSGKSNLFKNFRKKSTIISGKSSALEKALSKMSSEDEDKNDSEAGGE